MTVETETEPLLLPEYSVLLARGLSDTRRQNGGEYETLTIDEIVDAMKRPSALPKGDAPFILASTYHRAGGDDDARSHAAQRRHGQFVLIPIDIDKGNHALEEIDRAVTDIFGEICVFIYSTASAAKEERRWRVLMPLAEPLSFPDWADLVEAVYDLLDAQGVHADRSLLRAAQPFFLPNVPPERRGEDGQLIYYVAKYYAGPLADPAAAAASEAIAALRAKREAEEQRRVDARHIASRRRMDCKNSGRGSAIEAFNARHSIVDLLFQHGYEQSPRNEIDWRSPYQTSGSYATRIFEGEDGSEFWVSLSESDASAGLGAGAAGGGRYGDAFDIFVHFDCKGDFSAALHAAGIEVEQQRSPPPGPIPLDDHDGPLPVLPAPFPGFMAEAVEQALATAHKPQPEITSLAVLIGMASCCPGTVNLPDGLRLNLYGLGVAPTASGKDHTVRVARAIAKHGGAKLLGDAASGPGIEDELLSDQPMLSVQDEIAHTLAARQDKGNPHLKGVEQAHLRLFSASQGDYTTRSLASRNARTIENPCFNLLGFAVPTKLGEALSEVDAASGLLGRMLIAAGDASVVPQLGIAGSFQLSETMRSKLDEVRAAARLGSVIKIASEAREELNQLVLAFHEEEQGYPVESPERCLLGRTMEKAKRTAGVLAFFDNPDDPVITSEHLDWAVAFARSSDAMMLNFIRQHMHGGKVQADAVRVKRMAVSILHGEIKLSRPGEIAAVAAGQVPTSALLNRLRLSKRDLDDAIDQLQASGDMRRATYSHEPTAGGASKINTIIFPEE